LFHPPLGGYPLLIGTNGSPLLLDRTVLLSRFETNI
jgi:hypothetical protein